MQTIAKISVSIVCLTQLSVAYAESLARQNLDVYNQLEEIKAELQSLRGDIEVTQHQLAQLEQRQQDYYDDLNQRLKALTDTNKPAVATAPAISSTTTATPALNTPMPTTAAPNASTSNTPIPVQPSTTSAMLAPIDTTQSVLAVNQAGNDLAAYQVGYQLLQDKKYTEAAAAFNAYLQTYPQGEYVANVDYWLGEIYLIQQHYPQAEQAFSRVVNQYPAHPKAADALLKLGYVYEAMGDRQRAIETLNKVQQQYAGTAVAHLAKTKADALQSQSTY